MLRMLLFLLVILLANQTYGQGLEIDDALRSVDPGDRIAVSDDRMGEGDGSEFNADDILSEEGAPGFDPMDELDKIPRIRKEKEIAEKEKEIAEAKWSCPVSVDS